MLIRAAANCQTYLQHGITTVRDIGSVDYIALHVAKGIIRGLSPDVIASEKTLTMTGDMIRSGQDLSMGRKRL